MGHFGFCRRKDPAEEREEMESVNLIAQRLADMQSAASSSDGEDSLPKRPRHYEYQRRQANGVYPYLPVQEHRQLPNKVPHSEPRAMDPHKGNLTSPNLRNFPGQQGPGLLSWGDQIMVAPS